MRSKFWRQLRLQKVCGRPALESVGHAHMFVQSGCRHRICSAGRSPRTNASSISAQLPRFTRARVRTIEGVLSPPTPP
ncbi:hypothetical protein AB0N07_51850, partial [Streptomyces sp. NPDC051172]|uniref:hypothetical protein n=1 Tax=Streptomyces sp. NPDC051172 TaxID=3155796 RepID=UPI00344200F3